MRGYVETMPPAPTGWPAALKDPQIGLCLALLHGEPARPWSVDALAEAVHVSRSVLAARFTELVGLPPRHYLKRWRLATAARLLGQERGSLARIAEAIGYDSEAAFNRAFKREYGVSPGRWRHRIRSGGLPGADA